MNGNEAPESSILTTTDVHAGIDVRKLKLDVARRWHGKFRSKVFSNNVAGFKALVAWLSEDRVTLSQAHLCLEATGPYSEAFALWLCDAGWPVIVVNPARVKGFAQSELARNKTDKADAALIARFCAALAPEQWRPPSMAIRQLRSLVERLQALKDMHQQEVNRMEAAHATGDTYIREHVSYLEAAVKTLQKTIDDHIAGEPQLHSDAQLLASIQGIGAVTLAKVMAYAGNVERFTSAKALSAFASVCPQQRLSGTSVKGRSTISRRGHEDLRRSLYMPDMVALRYNPLVQEMALRLKAKGMVPKAIIAAAMHKLLHLIYGVLKTRKPFDANWAKNTATLMADPVTFSVRTVDFQDGI